MSPELAEILNRIGWRETKLLYPSPMIFTWIPTKNPGILARSKSEHKELEKSLDRYLEAFETILNGLPRNVEERIETVFRGPEEWDREVDWVPRLNALEDAVTGFLPFAKEIREQMDYERNEYWPSRGKNQKELRSKNQQAYEIARRMAKIFVVGLGEKPSRPGTNPNKERTDKGLKTAASGLFGTTVEDVFNLFGIRAGVRGPCEGAIEDLEKDNEAEYNRLLDIRASGIRRIPNPNGKVAKILLRNLSQKIKR